MQSALTDYSGRTRRKSPGDDAGPIGSPSRMVCRHPRLEGRPLKQPGYGWKQHWHRNGVVERVVFATRPRVTVGDDAAEAWLAENDLERTIGFFDGWEWGYPILDSTRFPASYVMP